MYHPFTNSTILIRNEYYNGGPRETSSKLIEEISNITLNDQPLPSLEMAHLIASSALIIIIIGELIQVRILHMIKKEDEYLKRTEPGKSTRGSLVKGKFHIKLVSLILMKNNE